jgi:hypothetical protein
MAKITATDGRTVYGARYRTERLARARAAATGEWVVMGAVGEWLVVRPVDAARLERSGYEVAR